ncbi:MAG: 30S ribosomal protein S2 [Candidatus Methanomethylicia archaeon]|nr:30S ribosomal protein S2 [Candidatus Methanomethylicia archaeon]MCX8169077.1 30S ribosomal protein S2 [Candidatus Methanomethylicia archaeon]MDW7988809.1 30S ribosomal protein S2 [Nitrososphaerota archaeon]
MTASQSSDLLVPLELYLSVGIHIGTRIKTKPMLPFIYRVRPDGLYVLDVKHIDERIRIAAKFISRFPSHKICAVSSRQYGWKPVTQFCTVVGGFSITGRFIPGTFTNPRLPHYREPSIVIVSDPRADEQAITEAMDMGIPVVALCDTDNVASGVELIIPVNNKGRKALALTYWLLARQVLRERGDISPDDNIPYSIEDFEAKPEAY